MSNSAAAQEPSMEEILASIRRIITDEEGNPTSEQKSQENSDSAKEMLGNGAAETEDGLLSSSQPMSPDDLDALFAPDEDDKTVSAKGAAAETGAESSQLEEASFEDDDEVMELTAAEIEDDETSTDDDELELIDGMDIVFDEIQDEIAVQEPVFQAALSPEPKPEPTPVVEPASAPVERPSDLESLISQQAATSVSESFSSLSGLLVSSQAKTMEDLLKEMLRPMLQSWLDENLPSLVEKMVAAEIRRLSGKG